MLRADQVSYQLADTVVVSETTLEVNTGEFVVVVGPNGAGKTTLLAMLAGELEPTSGSITWGSDSLREIPFEGRARRRAYLAPTMFDGTAFTVRDVVAMGRHPWRSQGLADAEVVEAAMRAVGVEHLADRIIGSLSTGEAQLGQIARILAQDTPLLLLDEPTAGMDLGHQDRILRTLADSTRESRTVVAVVHDLNAATSVADRMVIMSEGSVVAIGPPSEVLEGDLLSSVYAHPITVIDHPFRAGPLVLLLDQD